MTPKGSTMGLMSLRGVTENLERIINQEINQCVPKPSLRVSKTPRIDEVDRKLLGLEEIQKEARKRDNRA